MAIKLYYNKTTYQLITIDDGGESLIKGDDGSKSFEFYFGTGTELADFVLDATIPLTYEGRVTFKRADDETTNEVYLTPIAGGFYRYVIGDWVTGVEGELKITTRLKLGAAVTNFGIATIIVEDGVAPDDGSTISQLQYDAIMGTVNDVIIGTTPTAYDNTVSGLAAVDVQGAIDEVDADVDALTVRVTTAETDIDLLEGRATNLETFQSTTVPATYETISNVDTVRDRVTAVESGKEDVVDANAHRLRTTALEGANMFKSVAWDSMTGVITFTLFDDTTTTIDLPTEMIFDTVVYDDINMQLVFTLKNGTSFTVPIGDILTGIATQDWVVLNYYNKTQGDARYVTKDITAYTNLTAEENKTSARIYVDDNGVPKKMTLGEIYEGANTAPSAFAPNGVYQDLTAGYAIKSESGVDIDEEFAEIDEKIDAVELNVIDHEQRIDSIEAITRKQDSDIASVDDDGIGIMHMGKDVAETTVTTKIEGLLLDAEQLVTNGGKPFTATTGWISAVSSGVLSIASENLLNTGTGTDLTVQQYFTTNVVPVSGHKYHLNVKVRVTNSNANSINIYIGDNTVGNLTAYKVATQSSPALNTWYMLSGNLELTSQAGLLRVYIVTNYADATTANGKVTETEHAYLFLNSTLIANKQYSPLYSTTFDLISDAEIKIQMDTWVQDGTLPNDIMSVDMDKKITGVGKNLFDKSKYATDYAYKISVKPSTQYTWSVSALYKTYDKDMNEVSSGTNTTLTVASNVYYIAFSGISDKDTFMLVNGSVVGTYENYRSTSMYLDSGKVGYQLPNMVKDTIEFRNGKAYHVQRVKPNITYDGDEGWSAFTVIGSVYRVRITQPTDMLGTDGSILGKIGSFYLLNAGSTLVSAIWATNGFLYISILQTSIDTFSSKSAGTSTLTDFTNYLLSNNATIYYQLATPVETEIAVINNAFAYPRGTFYIEDMVRRIGVYNAGITVDKAISKLDNIYKLNDDGSSTKLAVSGATIAGDGLSFTHTSLSNGDFVWFDYYYQGTNVKGLSTVYYYGDKMIVADTTTGTVYKIIFTIDNGVITVDKVAV